MHIISNQILQIYKHFLELEEVVESFGVWDKSLSFIWQVT